jgi:hypothetical protein
MDPTPFFSDLKDAKKVIFSFFSYNFPAGTLSSVLEIKFFVLIFCVKIFFSSIISVRAAPL